jgi:hypothetical protein
MKIILFLFFLFLTNVSSEIIKIENGLIRGFKNDKGKFFFGNHHFINEKEFHMLNLQQVKIGLNPLKNLTIGMI